ARHSGRRHSTSLRPAYAFDWGAHGEFAKILLAIDLLREQFSHNLELPLILLHSQQSRCLTLFTSPKAVLARRRSSSCTASALAIRSGAT
ncbi:hypothetical protein, partial [Mesorhizobium sp. M1A.F.Ca.IN.022.05.2.1]|uniref:hypothetical protein n=1 Tax=Mesorhizobium sp. M1A.F.Ca.IN.022.05.2.1 TaxID=2496760 RepID=UPI0019CF8333